MSAFRTSWTILARRPAMLIAPTRNPSNFVRYKSTESKGVVTRPYPPTNGAGTSEGDIDLVPDHGTSAYSPMPVPSEVRGPDEPLDVGAFSGAPIDLKSRTVRIFKPAKPATQSGNWNGKQWRMDWDVLGKGHRWENSLMGWQSSGDPMQGTHIFFKTKEDAIHFAEKQGYEWFVQEPNERGFKPKVYASNFYHSPKKLKVIRTK
ncbi:ETC complex I subunit conserved region-domain-containing protein [Morchella snyderi]|nr:ETC complex I subunit conserved region-domain-containing protein [Morchella snyderi]